MNKYQDAIGYLFELRDEINSQWFSHICELAISASSNQLDEIEKGNLLKIFKGETSSINSGITTRYVSHSILAKLAPSALHFLQEINGFDNFKRLSNTLKLSLIKPITIIFGTNGAGKSSLCEAIKILANPERPSNPIKNVNSSNPKDPTFTYSFGDGKSITWNESLGFGIHSNKIKYFDSHVARRYIQDPLRLENIKLILTTTENVKGDVLVDLGVDNYEDLKSYYFNNLEFHEEELLNNKLSELARLEKLVSNEGLELLKVELKQLIEWRIALYNFYYAAQNISPNRLGNIICTLDEKKMYQKQLSSNLIPKYTNFDQFKIFLKALQEIFDLSMERKTNCPVCKRELDKSSWDVLKKYNEILTNKIEEEINELESERDRIWHSLEALRRCDVTNIKKNIDWVPTEKIQLARKTIANIKKMIPSKLKIYDNVKFSKYGEHVRISNIIKDIDAEITKRKNEINKVDSHRDEVINEIESTRKEVENLKFRKQIYNHKSSIQLILDKLESLSLLKKKFTDANFTQLLRKITIANKKAQQELVVNEFTTVLDDEYYALSEKHLSDFAVSLPLKGDEAEITMTPSVSGNPINKILSEGELRLHSLALFFAELKYQNQYIVILDDPVSSFDYNYIDCVSWKIRDFIENNPHKQMVIFTHNWDFFVQLQLTLKSDIKEKTAVKVLENCSVVDEYEEKVDQLKARIESILAEPGEPSKEKKENLAGYMRRLMEAIVNTYAFNGQKHQFKQKHQKVSNFQDFTKLKPLTSMEAKKLGDLFSSFSISEHDDKRGDYVNKDKTVFENRYRDILKIEDDIKTR